MTFKETTDYVFKHPFFKEALDKYQKGDPTDLKDIFFQAQFHVWETTVRISAKLYRKNKYIHHEIVTRALKDLPPPTTLDLYLPIPKQPELPFGNPDKEY